MRKLILILFTVLSLHSEANSPKDIVYHIKLGFIKGGVASIHISDTVYEGKEAQYYRLTIKTIGVADAIYKIHDIYETIADPVTLLPYKSTRKVSERTYRKYSEVLYYHDKDSVFSNNTGWQKAPDGLLDLITAFFYFTQTDNIEKVKISKTVTLPTLHEDEINNLTINYSGIEKIDTKLGKLPCYVLLPQIKPGKILKNSNGVRLYITQDTRIPVLLNLEMKVGSIKAILKEYDSNK
jgi:hypothetical protein